MFKVLFKILLALAAIFGIFKLLVYLDEKRSDYIEIYNDDGGPDEEYF